MWRVYVTQQETYTAPCRARAHACFRQGEVSRFVSFVQAICPRPVSGRGREGRHPLRTGVLAPSPAPPPLPRFLKLAAQLDLRPFLPPCFRLHNGPKPAPTRRTETRGYIKGEVKGKVPSRPPEPPPPRSALAARKGARAAAGPSLVFQRLHRPKPPRGRTSQTLDGIPPPSFLATSPPRAPNRTNLKDTPTTTHHRKRGVDP